MVKIVSIGLVASRGLRPKMGGQIDPRNVRNYIHALRGLRGSSPAEDSGHGRSSQWARHMQPSEKRYWLPQLKDKTGIAGRCLPGCGKLKRCVRE